MLAFRSPWKGGKGATSHPPSNSESQPPKPSATSTDKLPSLRLKTPNHDGDKEKHADGKRAVPPALPPKQESKPDMEKGCGGGKGPEGPYVAAAAISDRRRLRFPSLRRHAGETASVSRLTRTRSDGLPSRCPRSRRNVLNIPAAPTTNAGSVRRRRRATTKSSRRGFHGTDELLTVNEAEELCDMIQGNLVPLPVRLATSRRRQRKLAVPSRPGCAPANIVRPLVPPNTVALCWRIVLTRTQQLSVACWRQHYRRGVY